MSLGRVGMEENVGSGSSAGRWRRDGISGNFDNSGFGRVGKLGAAGSSGFGKVGKLGSGGNLGF